MPPQLSRRRHVALSLGLVLVLVSGLVACGATEETTTTDTLYRPTIRSATTRRPISREASEEFDRAIAAARASTSTGLGGGSSTTSRSTSTTRPTSSTSSRPDGSDPSASSTTASKVLGVEECKLFVQLLNFVSSLDQMIDPNDPSATAARVAEPIDKSRAGLEQLLEVSPASIRGEVDKIVNWLKAMAEGAQVDHDAARAAVDNVRSWAAQNCGTT